MSALPSAEIWGCFAPFQSRASSFLNRIETELDEKRRALGVEDALRTIDGVTSQMLVKLGENEIRTVDDLAGCATDDLLGWSEQKDGHNVQHVGYFAGIELSRSEAEAIIMSARVAAGWIEAAPAASESAEDAA